MFYTNNYINFHKYNFLKISFLYFHSFLDLNIQNHNVNIFSVRNMMHFQPFISLWVILDSITASGFFKNAILQKYVSTRSLLPTQRVLPKNNTIVHKVRSIPKQWKRCVRRIFFLSYRCNTFSYDHETTFLNGGEVL